MPTLTSMDESHQQRLLVILSDLASFRCVKTHPQRNQNLVLNINTAPRQFVEPTPAAYSRPRALRLGRMS